MADATPPPLNAAVVLTWMREHPDRLRELLREEDPTGAENAAAADAAVRAHLRFAAEGFPHGATPELAGRLKGLADALTDWFDEDREVFDHMVALGRGAVALEEHLIYGTDAEREPELHAALARRVRLTTWNLLFLRCLEYHLGPSYDGLSDAAITESRGRERELGTTILHMHKIALDVIQHHTGRPPTGDERAQSSQAAAVQAYVRQTVESAARALQFP
ncbi:MAG: hypothetical protein EXQ74_02600 [Thermoleophilia bacterium]|nr:hypothetical protein [Thermoleophilia bacterium]